MSESALARAAIAAIRLAFPKAIPIRVQSGQIRLGARYMRFADQGTPDWQILIGRGRSVWLEFKVMGQRPTKEQHAMHERFRANGHAVYVVHSVDEAIECVRIEMR